MSIPNTKDYFNLPIHSSSQYGGLRNKAKFEKQSKPLLPLVSIITIVRNGESILEKTILSVLEQSYDNIEYIIIDGDSTDGTLDIIRKYEDSIAYWLSEPDKGIADAWNKGIALCNGEIIGILNAGDYYQSDCIEQVVNNLYPNELSVTYGKTILLDDNNQVIKVNQDKFNPRNIIWFIGIYHPGCFATRITYEKIGIFNLNYRLAMDCDWIIRCYRKGVVFKKLDNICYMPTNGISNKLKFIGYGEYQQVLIENGYSQSKVYISMVVLAIKSLLKIWSRGKIV
jgi:glycosyltransferase involved in cell wall biosynthesis